MPSPEERPGPPPPLPEAESNAEPETDIFPGKDAGAGRVEDREDLKHARKPLKERAAHQPFWKRLGPGLITGVADDDPSGIGTYSVAGAQFGYALLWLVPFCIPLMIAVQEMCGRIAAVTGRGLAAVLKEHYPLPILWGTVLLLFLANTINVWADLNVMAASAQMLFGHSLTLWLTLLACLTLALESFVPYRVYVRYLKWMCLALLAYVVTALLPTVHPDWPQIARRLLLPDWSGDTAFLMTVVGFLGTTISPYLFFWQAGETVEEEIAEGRAIRPGKRVVRVSGQEIRMMRADTVLGMLASQGITFFIIVCTAAVLHARGQTNINTAQDAARALLPLGPEAYWLFTLGIVGSGLLGIPTLAGSVAYAMAETLGWRYGLYRRARRAHGFYLTIAVVLLLGYLLNFVQSISPIKGLLYAAVLNGVIAPPLIVLLLLLCNNPQVVGERRNSRLSNVLGILTVVLMTLAAALMFWSLRS